jgi:hypothetical protein
MNYATLANWHKNVDERWRIDPRRWRTDSWRNDSLAKRPDTTYTQNSRLLWKYQIQYISSNNTHIFVGQNGGQSNACLLSVLTLKCWKEPSSENVFESRLFVPWVVLYVLWILSFTFTSISLYFIKVSTTKTFFCFKIYINYEKSVEKKQYFSHAKCFCEFVYWDLSEEGGSSSQHALQLINIHNHDFSQC